MSAEETPQRRAGDAVLKLAQPNQRAVRTDVFKDVQSVTGILLTPGMVPNQHAQAALSTLLDKLEQAEKERDTDALTGVLNRGVFNRVMKHELSLRNDSGQHDRKTYDHPPLTVVMFDINDFKQVNTEHTHAGGDHAIKHVGRVLKEGIDETAAKHAAEEQMARILKDSLRKTDVVTRLGGDEFAVIMYDTPDSEPLRERLETIRKKIINTPCEFQDKTIKLGVAYGVHEVARGDTIDSIIADFSAKMTAHKKVVKAPKGGTELGPAI